MGTGWQSAAALRAGAAVVAVLTAVAAGPARGQAAADAAAATAPGAASAPGPGLLDRVQALGLSRLAGRVPVFHPPGDVLRAGQAQALIGDATAYLEAELGVGVDLGVALLTREQWTSLIRWQPYGIPGVAGRPPVVFLPATDDGLAAEDALSLEDRATAPTRRKLEAAGLGYAQAARRYVDLVALHELGHVYLRRLGFWPNSRWLEELLATYIGYAYLRERRPDQALVWEAVLQTYLDAVTPAHRSLADFDRLYFGVGAQNYVWYQAQFQRLVREVYDRRGLALLAALQPLFAAAERPPPDAAQVLDRLAPQLPGVHAWARALDKPNDRGLGATGR